MGSGSRVAVSGRDEGSGSPVFGACFNSGGTGIVGGSASAGSSEASTADGTEVCTLCRSVDCRESGGGRFRISAGVLFDAVATVSSLLSGAMPSFGIGIVGGSGLAPPLLVIVCPGAVSLTELEPASVDLLFSMVPTNVNETQDRP